MRKITALLLLPLMSGCTAMLESATGQNLNYHPNDYAKVRADIRSEHDEHRGYTTHSAPWINAGNAVEYFARLSEMNLAIPDRTQIYVRIRFRDWAFLDRAYSKGEQLSLSQIDRRVGSCNTMSCTVIEDVAVNLSEEQVRDFSHTGFDFQVAGSGGSVDVSIPAEYLRAFCDAVYGDNC